MKKLKHKVVNWLKDKFTEDPEKIKEQMMNENVSKTGED